MIQYLLTIFLIQTPAQAEPVDYCQRFFAELTFPPKTAQLASAFTLDRDRGVVILEPQIQSLKLTRYSSEIAHRLESNPGQAGAFKNIKTAMQIFDKSGDPREFEIIHDYIENYQVKPKKTAAPIKPHIWRYTLAIRNGVCVPVKVTNVVDGNQTTFDFDRCYQPSPPAPVACNSLKVFTDILQDKRFDHGSSSANHPNNNKVNP